MKLVIEFLNLEAALVMGDDFHQLKEVDIEAVEGLLLKGKGHYLRVLHTKSSGVLPADIKILKVIE